MIGNHDLLRQCLWFSSANTFIINYNHFIYNNYTKHIFLIIVFSFFSLIKGKDRK